MKDISVLPAPPQGAKARGTYEALLAAAERVLASHGLPGLTSTAVAAEAGVATGTFYSYFADKDEPLAALFALRLDELTGQVERLLTADALLDHGLDGALRAVVDAVVDGYRRHATVIRAALGRIPDSPLLRGIYWDRYERAHQAVAAFVRRGAAAGRVRAVRPEPLAHAVLVMIQGLNHPVLLAGDQRRRAAVSREVARALSALLAPDEADRPNA